MPYHSTLQKQIEKFIDKDISEKIDINNFLEAVNSAYLTFERDRKLTDHAFNISEQIMNYRKKFRLGKILS